MTHRNWLIALSLVAAASCKSRYGFTNQNKEGATTSNSDATPNTSTLPKPNTSTQTTTTTTTTNTTPTPDVIFTLLTGSITVTDDITGAA